MELSVTALGYLCLRLSPILVVLILVLSSLLLGNIRGLVYFIGLGLTIFLQTLVFGSQMASSSATCNLITISGVPLNAGLSQLILSFSFLHLLYSTPKFHLFRPTINLYLVILFPLLIGFDLMFNINNNCMNPAQMLLTSTAFGGVCGATWSYILSLLKLSDMAFFSNQKGSYCSRPSNQKLRCKTYQYGELIV